MLAVPYASKSAFIFGAIIESICVGNSQVAVGTLEASTTFVVGISVVASSKSKGLANLAASLLASGTEVSDSMSWMDAQKSKTSDICVFCQLLRVQDGSGMSFLMGKTREILEDIQYDSHIASYCPTSS